MDKEEDYVWQPSNIKLSYAKVLKVKYHDSKLEKIKKIPQGDWIDLRSSIDILLNAFDYFEIPLGISIKIPSGFEAQIKPRSSTYKTWGIIQTNGVGCIDESYAGNSDIWKMPVLAMRNTEIKKNDRICQFRIIEKQPDLMFEEVNDCENDVVYKKKNWFVSIIDKNNYKYFSRFEDIKNNPLLPFHPSNPHTLDNISLWLKLNNKRFELCEINIYIGNKNKLNFYCFKCKNIFNNNWSDISQNKGCGICKGFQVVYETSFGFLRPEFIEEWIKSENDLTPYQVTKYSHENIFWQCKDCGNKWNSSISNRTNGRGCPKCANELKESKIATKLKKYILEKYNAKIEYKILRNPITNYWLPFDVYIYDNIFIEIMGEQHYKIGQWHKSLAKRNNRTIEEEFEYRQYLDLIKKEYAEKNGIYIEVDLRKIKTIEQAIEYIENILK